jgi:nucleoside-diphosphate-sugar epimerase
VIVAVTGATGYVGRFVVDALAARGHHVRALSRPASDRSGFAHEVDWLTGCLTEPESLGRLCAGADALVHAALDHLPDQYRGGEGDDPLGYLETNLMGSLRLLEAARAAGVERCVVLSSRAVYARRSPGVALDEAHPVWPDTLYGASKAALEAFVSAFGLGGGWQVCALRPTAVYGRSYPLSRTKWHDLIRSTLRGEAWPLRRSGGQVHGEDVARAVALLLEAPDVAGRTFNCGDLYLTDRDVAAEVQRITGLSGPLPEPPPAPPHNLMVCRGLADLGFRFGGRPLFERTIHELVEAIRGAGQ